MSEPEEYYIDGPSFIESSELEEVTDEVSDRLKKLESKLAASDGQAIESSDGEPLHAGLATLTAKEVINRLKITPFDMVDILNGINIYDDNNNFVSRRRLVTTDEERFWAHTYSEPYFTEEMLKNVKVYQLNFDQYCDDCGIQPSSKTEKADTSDLEPQLAEAQKHIEALEQWNKRLNEQNKKLRPELAEKNSRIAELESQLAIFAENKGKRDNSAATIGKLRKDLQRWKTAFPLAVYATEKLLTHPAETTKKTRSELLPFICEACPSKCAEPKFPCAVFSKEQFEVWRDAVPPAHVDKSDKAYKKDGSAYPLNTVETVGGEGNIEN